MSMFRISGFSSSLRSSGAFSINRPFGQGLAGGFLGWLTGGTTGNIAAGALGSTVLSNAFGFSSTWARLGTALGASLILGPVINGLLGTGDRATSQKGSYSSQGSFSQQIGNWFSNSWLGRTLGFGSENTPATDLRDGINAPGMGAIRGRGLTQEQQAIVDAKNNGTWRPGLTLTAAVPA